MRADDRKGIASCDDRSCEAWAFPIPLDRLADQLARAAGVDPNPPGWPRPRIDGQPVPWVTPVTAGRAWWRIVHGTRLTACQIEWRCQVCGEALPDEAVAVVDDTGRFLTSAPSCGRCADLAVAVCPRLVEVGPLVVGATREDIEAGGASLVDALDALILGDPLRGWRLVDADDLAGRAAEYARRTGNDR